MTRTLMYEKWQILPNDNVQNTDFSPQQWRMVALMEHKNVSKESRGKPWNDHGLPDTEI